VDPTLREESTVTDTTTSTLPVLPLTTGVVLPGMVITIAVETPEALAAMDAVGDDGHLLLVPVVDGRHATVGTLATIESRGSLPSGAPALVVRATERARLGSAAAGTGDVLWLEAQPVDPEVTEAARELAIELRAAFRTLFEEIGGHRLVDVLRGIEEPDALADAAGWWPDLSLARKVELLETIDVAERLEKVLAWVKESLAELSMQARIRTEVSEGLEKSQREFLLRQQLAAIRKELGEVEGGAESGSDSYAERLDLRDLPATVRAAAEKEVARLERAGDQSPESGWIRTWLDTVLEVPWEARSADQIDLGEARTVLDADHTGLDDVKDRILEDLAVRKLRAERGLDAPPSPSAPLSREPDAGSGGTDSAPVEEQATEDPDALVKVVDLDVLVPESDVSEGSDPRPEDHEASPVSNRRHGTILTLVGPPGVGKTSLGESIARALGREFVRVALGGVHDEAEIRGHRRTYVGAGPGRVVKAITEAGTMNPVMLLDEIDKVGNDWRGDPSAALLEVLDPAQNHSFRDHYLEVELDLSDVLFIATANQLDTIPAPLLDRMEVVSLDGYTDAEKVTIARDHLLADQRDRAGLTEFEVAVTDDALLKIIRDHTREAGVRSLNRALAKVMRKVAVEVAARASVAVTDEGTDSSAAMAEPGPPGPTVRVDEDAVANLLGRARFHDTDLADRTAVPGVATGLAVTGAGGDVLFVETSALGAGPDDSRSGGPSLTVTGQLGDVMKESATIALSYVRSHRDELAIPPGADERAVHVHFPAGAVPKDGPSAGITMTTALVSLFTDRKVKPNLAMTGEVTLQGRVLPIGGVKQKLLAAHRLGMTEVILPAGNEGDLEDVPASVLAEMRVHLAGDVAEVVALALEPAA